MPFTMGVGFVVPSSMQHDRTPTAPTVADGPPDWIRESWRAFVADAAAYVRTSIAIVRRPRNFAAAWAAGRERALNPLAFLATSAALLGAAQVLVGYEGGGNLLSAVLGLVAPYAHFAWLGVLAHAALRALGSRQPLRASLAASLYVGGAPALVFTVAFYVLSGVLVTATHTQMFDTASAALPRAAHIAVAISVYVGFAVVMTYLGAALVGAHDVPPWKGLVAIVVALAVSGALYGLWRPPATVGAHFVLWLRRSAGGPPFSLRF